jgi:hypothetical protein
MTFRALTLALLLALTSPPSVHGNCPLGQAVIAPVLTCAGTCTCTPSTTVYSGTITDGAGQYANNLNCVWLISSPTQTITFNIVSIKTQLNEDNLKIWQCGSDLRESELSCNNLQFVGTGTSAGGFAVPILGYARVQFTTSASIVNDGFEIQWSSTNSSDCALCATGKYKSTADNSLCQNCPANSLSVVESSSCTCKLGYTGSDGGLCTTCQDGKFTEFTGATECSSCLTGKILNVSLLQELNSRAQFLSEIETFAPFIHVHNLQCQNDLAGLYYLTDFSDNIPYYRKKDGEMVVFLKYEKASQCTSDSFCTDKKNHWKLDKLTGFSLVTMAYATSDARNPASVSNWFQRCTDTGFDSFQASTMKTTAVFSVISDTLFCKVNISGICYPSLVYVDYPCPTDTWVAGMYYISFSAVDVVMYFKRRHDINLQKQRLLLEQYFDSHLNTKIWELWYVSNENPQERRTLMGRSQNLNTGWTWWCYDSSTTVGVPYANPKSNSISSLVNTPPCTPPPATTTTTPAPMPAVCPPETVAITGSTTCTCKFGFAQSDSGLCTSCQPNSFAGFTGDPSCLGCTGDNVLDAGMLAQVDSDAQILSASEEYPPFIYVRAVECNPAIAGVYRMLRVAGFSSENDRPMYEKNDGETTHYLASETPNLCSLGSLCVANKHHWRFTQIAPVYTGLDVYAVSDNINPSSILTWNEKCSGTYKTSTMRITAVFGRIGDPSLFCGATIDGVCYPHLVHVKYTCQTNTWVSGVYYFMPPVPGQKPTYWKRRRNVLMNAERVYLQFDELAVRWKLNWIVNSQTYELGTGQHLFWGWVFDCLDENKNRVAFAETYDDFDVTSLTHNPPCTEPPAPPPPPSCAYDEMKCVSDTPPFNLRIWDLEGERRDCHCCAGFGRLSVRFQDTEELWGRGCLQCKAGKYSASDFTKGSSYLYENEVSDLGNGVTYNPESVQGDSLCLSCPTNSYSVGGSSDLSSCMCNAGFTGLNGGTCEACPAGKFKNTVGDSSCTDCTYGTFSTSGATVCKGCDSGSYYSSSTGASACILCPVNQYSWGVPQVQSAPTACVACNGTYKSMEGANQEVMFLFNNDRFVLSRDLNYGNTNPSTNSFALAVLRESDSSQFTGHWTDLTAGEYLLAWDSQDPELCTSGVENSWQGKVALTQESQFPDQACFLSQKIINAKQRGAIAIIVYSYSQSLKRELNTALSYPIPAASIANTYGKVLTQHVMDSGVKVTLPWAACSSCPNDSVFSEISKVCECNQGYTSTSHGTCKPCAAGSFKPTTGSESCTLCAVNTYNTAEAAVEAVSCTACPIGKGNNATGSTACSDLPLPTCQAGQIWNASLFACVACGLGMYQPVGPF